MGGLSAKELLRGPSVPREGDFVEYCLENLSPSPRPRDIRYDKRTRVLYEEDSDEYDMELKQGEGMNHRPSQIPPKGCPLTSSE